MYFVELLIHTIESFIYLGKPSIEPRLKLVEAFIHMPGQHGKTNKHGGTENDYQTCGDDDYDNHFIRQVHTSIVPMLPRKY